MNGSISWSSPFGWIAWWIITTAMMLVLFRVRAPKAERTRLNYAATLFASAACTAGVLLFLFGVPMYWVEWWMK
jgi:hypothetical protein